MRKKETIDGESKTGGSRATKDKWSSLAIFFFCKNDLLTAQDLLLHWNSKSYCNTTYRIVSFQMHKDSPVAQIYGCTLFFPSICYLLLTTSYWKEKKKKDNKQMKNKRRKNNNNTKGRDCRSLSLRLTFWHAMKLLSVKEQDVRLVSVGVEGLPKPLVFKKDRALPYVIVIQLT